MFCYVLEFLLNTDKKTGISTSKLEKQISDKVKFEIKSSLTDLIDFLVKNNTGKDTHIATTQHFIKNISDSTTLEKFISEIITKKYKCGVTAKVASTILPNLIKNEHEVMLAHKFDGKIKEPVSVSLKLDGIRCTAIIENGTITFLSRQGKVIKGLKQIKMALKSYELDNWVLDGELIRINHDNLPSDENFRLTTEVVNSKSDNKTGLEFVLFDMFPVAAYRAKEWNKPYEDRLKLLENMFYKKNKHVRLVPIYGITDDVDLIYGILSNVTSQGLEGLMLNTLSGKYAFGKRSKDLLKVKAMQTCDIKCIGLEEGEGKYTGTLGKIVCDYKGNILRVGSGFTDEQRFLYWNNPHLIQDKIVEIQYFEESKDKKTDELSLRFPVFKRLRDDKDEESYN